ncbi:hypothetical protein [Halorientalis salina]|uniref:hypothetical protein n=1 Tax=Halorientalis salina TaxID=2932266 RepID=UPI0010ACFBBC|nr:hypothetical protein [Halorientalis salina]
MQAIWDDDGTLRESFRSDMRELADRASGDLEGDDESTLFCSFEPTSNRSSMRVGVYYANGRQTLRFDTIREEIELAMVNHYEIDRARLVIGSEKGSRTFSLDAASGEYSVSKESV